ncbi:MAG: PAS domain-containing protein [Myxococcaceae bacterium]|nr:PAS domain-containing protein [Myxococcaceae bacterium]
MKLGIRAQLFLVSLGLIACSVLAADLWLSTALDADLVERVRGELLQRLALVEHDASALEAPLLPGEAWSALAHELAVRGGDRVTFIARDGRVLGDSELSVDEVAEVERHADRPELIEALATGTGSSTRFSNTLKRRMMYVATGLHRGGAVVGTVRLAKPLTEVDEAIARLRRLVYLGSALALGLAVLLSTLASHWMSRRARALTAVARRMADGELTARTRAEGSDELAALGQSLDQLAQGLEQALGSLRADRDLMGRVLQGMREGILLVDRQGRVALANGALREMLLLGAEAVGRPLLEVIRHAELKQLLDQAHAGAAPSAVELELGELKPRRLLAHASALGGEPGGVLAVFVDVTQLRRLETLRKDFVANVSHELRTPVASVRSAAETLRRVLDTQPEAAPEFVEMIERNAERLQQLIDDLLDLSRIESKEFKLSPEPLELAAVVRHTLSVHRERADARRMRLTAEVPADLPRLTADRRGLEQVLSNLVENAVKYAGEGGSVVVRGQADGASVRIAVQDSGPGIEQRHLQRIFERFYRVDPGRSRDLGGTGLGLSIVKHLVEAMGGSVTVESTLGRGTTFEVSLPRA